jgi:hypothetical protein
MTRTGADFPLFDKLGYSCFGLSVFDNRREIKKRMSPLPKLDIPLSVFIKTHWLRLCHLSYQKSENFQGKIFSGEKGNGNF